ncbi:MAG: HAMP domain-containing sensor histidine kinase [Actinomycetota bacterium]|nr:HAMP domain-containing sensor histidine kinase [Actinomycetota bacterium]
MKTSKALESPSTRRPSFTGYKVTQKADLSKKSRERGSKRTRVRIGTVPRLVAALFVVTAAVLGLVVVQISKTFESKLVGVTRTVLVDEINEFQRSVQGSNSSNLFGATERYIRDHRVTSQGAIAISIAGDPILGSNGSQTILKSPLVQSWITTPPKATIEAQFKIGTTPYLGVVAPVLLSGKVVGVMVATSDLISQVQQYHQMVLLVLFEAGIALLFTMGSGYFLLRRVLTTVGRITSAAISISNGDTSTRIEYKGATDEVGLLAHTFDNMLNRLEEIMDSQKRLLSDVSHQLKTPLTIIKGNLELIERSGEPLSEDNLESFEAAKEEIVFMSHLIDQLLLLGRTLERDFIKPEPVALRAFLADIYTSSTVIASRDWRYVEPPDIVVDLDAGRVRGALLNLIENASKVTQDGDIIEISGKAIGDLLEISISDSGPGVPKGREEEIFRRFERGNQPYKKGAGLGLSIVDAVARAHHGYVSVGSSIYGGASFTFSVPLNVISLNDDLA